MIDNHARRIALLGRIRRGLRAINSGRIDIDTFDRLLTRWDALERSTSR